MGLQSHNADTTCRSCCARGSSYLGGCANQSQCAEPRSRGIDRSCKPCDDFYQYSIGQWHEKHPIPPSQTRWGKRWAGADATAELLKGILDTHTGKTFRAGSNAQFLSDFYSSCMDAGTIDSRGARPLTALLRRISSVKSRSGLQGLLEYLTASGMDAPLFLTSRAWVLGINGTENRVKVTRYPPGTTPFVPPCADA